MPPLFYELGKRNAVAQRAISDTNVTGIWKITARSRVKLLSAANESTRLHCRLNQHTPRGWGPLQNGPVRSYREDVPLTALRSLPEAEGVPSAAASADARHRQ